MCHNTQVNGEKTVNITLFHATNELSSRNMLKNGIGLNLNDYKQIVNKIALKYKITNKVIDRVFHRWTKHEDINRIEYQGGVCFYPNFEMSKDISELYAKMGGEWKGLLIEMLIKSHARYIKKSFNSNEIQRIYHEIKRDFTGQSSKPVVVEVRIPQKMIVNQREIGENVELYTRRKVSSKYIVAIHRIN